MLKSKVGQKLASLTQPQLFDTLINDAYKPKMHKIYATYLRGVKVDFALNVRKSPFQLKKIEQEVTVRHHSSLCASKLLRILSMALVSSCCYSQPQSY